MDNLDIVFPETAYPCRPTDIFSKTTPALRVFYDRKRLSVELFHALADGGAAIVFVKTLLARYLQLGGADIPADNGILDITEAARPGELADAYRDNFMKHAPKRAADPMAWQDHSLVIADYLKMIHAAIPADELLTLAKSRGLTLTDYLTGAYLYAFYRADPDAGRSRKPIQISVSVSLRNLYPTETLRNFSLFANVGFHPRTKEFSDLTMFWRL